MASPLPASRRFWKCCTVSHIPKAGCTVLEGLFIETLRGNVEATVRRTDSVRDLLGAMLSWEWKRVLLQWAHRLLWQICGLHLVVFAIFFALVGFAQHGLLVCYRRFGRAYGCHLQGSRYPPRSWLSKGLYLTQNYNTTLTCDVTSCFNDIIKKDLNIGLNKALSLLDDRVCL